MTSNIRRLRVFSVLRNRFSGEYFTADDVLEAWQERYPDGPAVKKRNIQMMLSRLTEDGLLARPLLGVYTVRKASGEEKTIEFPERATKSSMPRVRRRTS